jgi:hypothetical protein
VNVRRIRTDDIVRCDVRGQHFYARIVDKDTPGDRRQAKVEVEPLLPALRVPTRFVTSGQIVEHYSKRKG